jgi:hypothetical protein
MRHMGKLAPTPQEMKEMCKDDSCDFVAEALQVGHGGRAGGECPADTNRMAPCARMLPTHPPCTHTHTHTHPARGCSWCRRATSSSGTLSSAGRPTLSSRCGTRSEAERARSLPPAHTHAPRAHVFVRARARTPVQPMSTAKPPAAARACAPACVPTASLCPRPVRSAAPSSPHTSPYHHDHRHHHRTQGGMYHGRILLPADYPFKPPSFMMLSPSGRFEVMTK